MAGGCSQGCPPDEPTASPALPGGEHTDPFVIAEELRDELDDEYPKVDSTPGSTWRRAGA
jgi:hypothetical protein